MKLKNIYSIFGFVFLVYLFLGFMVLPLFNTISQIFTVKNAAGETDCFLVFKFLYEGTMSGFIFNSLKLAVALVLCVNVIGVSIVLLTEYFDIKGAPILRLAYMTPMIYSGVALVAGFQFLYNSDGIMTTWLCKVFPFIDSQWFTGFNAVLFTLTFASTGNHSLFLRNAIRTIDYSTIEAARNMGAGPFKTLLKVVFPTMVPTLISLTVICFTTGLCAMSTPTLLGYDSINPEIVRLAGSSSIDEAFPQARAALLSIILAMFTIIQLVILTIYEKKGKYLSVSKTKTKLIKQKISNKFVNIVAHLYAYVLFIIYMTPVIMLIIFSLQNYKAIEAKTLDFSVWTLSNFVGKADFEFLTNRGKTVIREGAISGLFANPDTISGIRLSFILSAIAAALACVIVVIACEYIFKNKNKKRAIVVESCLMFPWLLPTILICYSYRIFFNDNIWYVFGQNLYYKENVRLLIIMAYTVIRLPYAIRMIKASFYSIDEELENAARNLGASSIYAFIKVKLPVIMPNVWAVFALTFLALFSEYGMAATFHSSYGKTYSMVVKDMTVEAGRGGYNVNAVGRQCASTVFKMILSSIILLLVYGLGSMDLREKLYYKRICKTKLKSMLKFIGFDKGKEE